MTRHPKPLRPPASRFSAPLIFIFSLLTSIAAPAQQFTFQPYEQNQGLKNHDVFKLLQDKSGFLWCATENGVFRYDGSEFRRFGASEGLQESLIIDLHQDASGRIWAASYDHIYFLSGNHFEVLPTTAATIQLGAGQRLTSIDPRHILFLNHSSLMLAQSTGTPEHWTVAPYFSPQQIAAHPELAHLHSVFADRDNTLWLGCNKQLCHATNDRIEAFGDPQGIPNEAWHYIYRDHQGDLWVRNPRHIRVLAPESKVFVPRDITPESVATFVGSGLLTISEDRDGRVLTQSSTGIARWSGDHWQTFDRSNGIDFTDISSILSDRQGSLWFSTRGHGLRRWLGYDQIENWTVSQGLQNSIVWSIFRDRQNHLWLGDDLQVGQLDETQKRILPIPSLQKNPIEKLDGIAQSPDESIWLVNITGHLLHSNPITQRFTESTHLPSTARLFDDSSHRIWILSREGLYIIRNPATSAKPEKIDDPLTATDAFADGAEGPDGTLWFISDHQLYRLHGDQWTHISLDSALIKGQMRNIAIASDGTLWIGGGLPSLLHLRVDGNHASLLGSITTPQIVSVDIQFVRFDHRGWLWIGTDLGVEVFDGLQWRLLTERDGLVSNDTNEGAFYADRDGSVWVGVNGGAIHLLHPDQLFSPTPLQLAITSATLGDHSLNLTGARNSWRWHSSPLDIAFTSFNYDRQGSTSFRYRLVGLEKNWNQTAEHRLHYPAMPPGTYRFEVQAIDPDQLRQSAIASFTLSIRPPWWQTRLFYFFLVILSFTLSILVWRWRERRLIKRQQMLEQLIAQRTSELEAEKRELIAAREALHQQATHDSLTGLWNRSAIVSILERELALARRESSPLVVVLADIDYFKKINDTLGHLAGDAILRDAAHRMFQNIRPMDFIGRYGGEEFLIVLPGLAPNDPAARLIQLQQAISGHPFNYLAESIQITSSFGAAWTEAHTNHNADTADTAEDLIRRADEALYLAKASGRNRVVFHVQPSHPRASLDML